jgi:hypothetical protein
LFVVVKMAPTARQSRFGMDYGSPGQLGGLGGGYQQPSLMYFGDTFVQSLFGTMRDDPLLAARLSAAAKRGDMAKFRDLLSK